jgi:hypothetical protein
MNRLTDCGQAVCPRSALRRRFAINACQQHPAKLAITCPLTIDLPLSGDYGVNFNSKLTGEGKNGSSSRPRIPGHPRPDDVA